MYEKDIEDEDSQEVITPRTKGTRRLQMNFRIGKAEIEQLEYLCLITGLNASALIRRMIMAQRLPVVDVGTAILELRRQGGQMKHLWLESGKMPKYRKMYIMGKNLIGIAKRLEKELLK